MRGSSSPPCPCPKINPVFRSLLVDMTLSLPLSLKRRDRGQGQGTIVSRDLGTGSDRVGQGRIRHRAAVSSWRVTDPHASTALDTMTGWNTVDNYSATPADIAESAPSPSQRRYERRR